MVQRRNQVTGTCLSNQGCEMNLLIVAPGLPYSGQLIDLPRQTPFASLGNNNFYLHHFSTIYKIIK